MLCFWLEREFRKLAGSYSVDRYCVFTQSDGLNVQSGRLTVPDASRETASGCSS